ncbi:MAG: Lsr2 family protein [Gordonia sp. (in: high G+C Gram-positive bacteria)]|uniref:histone-like nucleoid-structuring protein Lsr2 n=1 Tax=Gordonia sp. (in: high G+C Gram-positive bacteria) TaxID=84139 RepID=UPI0039E54806
MASITKVQYIDDITGQEVNEKDLVIVEFSIDGVTYRLDTTEAGSETFYAAVAEYVEKARRVGEQKKRPGRVVLSSIDFNDVRAWAKENGYPVSAHGRIPLSVMEAYDKAH